MLDPHIQIDLPPWQVHPNEAQAEFLALLAPRKALRLEPISLCLHGDLKAGPTYACYTSVWMQRQTQVDWRVLPLANPGPAWDWTNILMGQGYNPYIVTGEHQYVAVVVRKGGPDSFVKLDQSLSELPGLNDYFRTIMFYPAWAEICRGADDQPRIHYVLARQPGGVPFVHWNILAYDRLDYYDAMARGFVRPDMISMVDVPRTPFGQRYPLYCVLYRDEHVDGLYVRVGLSLAGLEAELTQIKDWGLMPIRIHARGAPGQPQAFNLIAARAEGPRPRYMHVSVPAGTKASPWKRVWRGGDTAKATKLLRLGSSGLVDEGASGAGIGISTGPAVDVGASGGVGISPKSPFAPIDNWVINYMKAHNVRVASLAIGYQGRLAYTRAFTRAEADYPIATPRTIMRVGSLSKVITCLAALRLWDMMRWPIQQLFAVDPQNNIAALLGYPEPADPRFKSRSVAHLLTHTAQFADGWLRDANDQPVDNGFADLGGVTFAIANWLSFKRTNYNQPAPVPWRLRGEDYLEYIFSDPGPEGTGWFQPGKDVPQLVMPGNVVSYSGISILLLAELVRKKLRPDGLREHGRVVREQKNFFFHRLGLPVPGARETLTNSYAAPYDYSEARYHPQTPTIVNSLAVEDVIITPGASIGFPAGHVDPDKACPGTYEAWDFPWGLPTGGWAMSASELVKIFSSLDITEGQPGSLFAQPGMNVQARQIRAGTGRSFAFYHPVWSYSGGRVAMHYGETGGMDALAYRRQDRVVVALITNFNDNNGPYNNFNFEQFPVGPTNFSDTCDIVFNAMTAADWPTQDLFPNVGIVTPTDVDFSL